MKTKITTKIIANTEISKGIYRLVLAGAPESDGLSDIAATAVPGQFVNVYLNSKTMLLPRPFGISDVERGERCKTDAVTGENIEADINIDSGAGDGADKSDDSPRIVLVYAVVGAGTAELASYAPGTEIQILGSQGNGYNLDELDRHVLLIGGGLGIPPLLFAARRIRETIMPGNNMKITALLGYRDVPYYVDDIGRYCDDVFYISENAPLQGAQSKSSSSGGAQSEASPSNSAHGTVLGFALRLPKINGTVMDMIACLIAEGRLELNNTSILSCGSTPMLKAVAEWTAAHGIPAQVSLEERMGCGYGACVGCTVEIKNASIALSRPEQPGAVPSDVAPMQPGAIPNSADPTPKTTRKKVCKDGPVFPAEVVVWR